MTLKEYYKTLGAEAKKILKAELQKSTGAQPSTVREWFVRRGRMPQLQSRPKIVVYMRGRGVDIEFKINHKNNHEKEKN